jgi:hypothetical protein
MTAQILLAADLDPTVFLGGDLPALAGNARAGRGPWVLAEACEAYDGFLYLHPQVAVVLNVEADHLDYHGTEAHVIASFVRFVGQVKPGGTVILCGDDPKARALSGAVAAPEQTLVLYGLGRRPPRWPSPRAISIRRARGRRSRWCGTARAEGRVDPQGAGQAQRAERARGRRGRVRRRRAFGPDRGRPGSVHRHRAPVRNHGRGRRRADHRRLRAPPNRAAGLPSPPRAGRSPVAGSSRSSSHTCLRAPAT